MTAIVPGSPIGVHHLKTFRQIHRIMQVAVKINDRFGKGLRDVYFGFILNGIPVNY